MLSGRKSTELPLAPANVDAESLQNLQELGRIVFQPDLTHNFHKCTFVCRSQSSGKVSFRLLNLLAFLWVDPLSANPRFLSSAMID
jgi:hypothetical protein